MRIVGQASLGASGQTQLSSSDKAGGIFRIASDASEAQNASRITDRFALSSLQGLMTLQEQSEPVRSKRHRAARRGFVVLDALASLKVGLLAGSVDPRALLTLQATLTEARIGEQDTELREVFNAIDTRAAVELAKLGR
jgi:hypothetical protein